MTKEMDEAAYIELTGHPPELDDMERVNCPNVGEPGHMACGLCPTCEKPAWTCTHFAETVATRMEAERRGKNA